MFYIIPFLFILGVTINYFVIRNYNFFKLTILLDKEYYKPQSFHKNPVLCFGGSSIYILFLIIFIFFDIKFLKQFFLLATVSFFIGLLEDLKIKFKPIFRLTLLIISFFFTINFFDININKLNIEFLNIIFNEYNYLKIVFITLCFIFIINGSNFIDGFNGLLIIHASIILSIINLINYYYLNHDLLIFGLISFSIILSFAIFNFPKASLFLGDSGSYLIGTLISYLIIQTSNYNPNIPSFFFSCLLYYLFFEVFFSFFRKIIYEKKNPLIPDKYHLHMLFYSKIIKKKKLYPPNPITGFSLNLIYIFTMMPVFYFYKNIFFLNYYFFILIIIYCFSYFKLRKI